MHFEWVGERRDQLSYPSRFCPNIVTTSVPQSATPLPNVSPAAPTTQRATMFADDGFDPSDT